MGLRQPTTARLKALVKIPWAIFEHLGNGGCHLWGFREVRVFTLTFIPTHSAQVPVLAYNVSKQGG